MNQQLDALLKYSEEFTRSAWGGVAEVLKLFQVLGKPAEIDSAGEMLNRLVQLNQLTLAVLQQYRSWERMSEGLKQFSESLLAGLKQQPDDRQRELEMQISDLRSRLNEQEKRLQELQAKLRASGSATPDANLVTTILSEFLDRQAGHLRKLAQPGD